jgi:predicted negative regulator of RcsB-dependent stress response
MIVLFLYADKDFKYSYIDIEGNQISYTQRKQIMDGYDSLNSISNMVKEGDVDRAYDQILAMESSNKIDILKSPIIILKSEIMLKKDARRFAIEGAISLEKAINSSLVHEDDLPQAYMLLIDLLLKINKIDEAQYFADMLTKSFDDPLVNAYGKIYQSKIYTYKKDFDKSTRMLYEILTKTKNIEVATIVAHELFDVFLLNNQADKAYELIKQVVDNNIEYYVNNSFEALKKVKKLQENGMPEFAAKILETILSKTNNPFLIEEFKYRLAVSYMDMYTVGSDYLPKARVLFEEVYNDFRDGKYAKESKMYIDEILMRERRIEPMVLAERYSDSFSMEQKVLLQELLNLAEVKDYENILRAKKVYDKIPATITKRFGYENIDSLFDNITAQMIKDYLEKDLCKEMSSVINHTRAQTFQIIIENEQIAGKLFRCMIDYPNEQAFFIAKESFNNSRNGDIYLALERVAMNLELLDEAYNMSLKVEMLNDKEILKKEFLYKFLILSQKGDKYLLERFFQNTLNNPDLIQSNIENPLIIDFYYRYYFYLLDKELKKEAYEILTKFYNKQVEFKARVYSPFVEMELAKYESEKKNYQKALEFLDEGFLKSRYIRKDMLVQLYYEKAKIYKATEEKKSMDEFVKKCVEVEGLQDNLYQQMCKRL